MNNIKIAEYAKEDFPKVARVKWNPKIINSILDFKEGELITFSHWCERPNSYKEGLAFYKGSSGIRLMNIKNLEIDNECKCLEYEKYYHQGQKYGRCYDCGEEFEIY